MSAKRELVQAILTYVGLLALLLLSVGSLLLHLGTWHPLLLLLVAAVQGTLVILFFMQVRDSSRLIWLFAGGGFLWLGIFLIFVISDYISRSWWRG